MNGYRNEAPARDPAIDPYYDTASPNDSYGVDHKASSDSPSYPLDEKQLLVEKSYGIRKIEIISKQYGPRRRVMVFFFIFLVAYCYGLDMNVRYSFQATAQSSFGTHSLLSTVAVATSIIAAAAQPLFARLSDVFGRVELVLISILFYIVGTVVEATAKNVNQYAAGAIIYQFGLTGIQLLFQLLVGDFSLLNWRLLSSFIPALPFIINTWISGNIVNNLRDDWEWGIGMWAIIVPVASIPLILSLLHMKQLAKRSGDLDELKGKSDYRRLGLWGFLKFLFFKIDLVGLVLLVGALAMILVPLTLAGGVSQEWKQARIIAPLVVGFCFVPLFISWEWKGAPVPIIPFSLLKDRGIWAALCIAVLFNFTWHMQGDYMFSVLQVAVNQTPGSATRITSLYSFVSVITGTIFGIVVSRVRYLKPFIVFGACCWVTAMGMLIHFRGGEGAKNGIIGSLCFLGFAAGFFTYPIQASIQSCTDHEHMAVVTSLYLASYNVGSALGGCVSGAIWTQTLFNDISREMAAIGVTDEAVVTQAYGSPFDFILTYTWDTPERQAVVAAYRHVQRLLLITAVCLSVPILILTLFLRNHKLISAQNRFDPEIQNDEKVRRELEEEKRKNMVSEKSGVFAKIKGIF